MLDVHHVFQERSLNPLMAEGRQVRESVRRWITGLLTDETERDLVEPHLVPLADVTMHLPVEVADYVDFYASLEHASNVGRIFRPDQEPLLPNWRHLPVGYHGRAGTIVPSGTPVIRPSGQRRGPDGPTYGPSARLDIEAELGFVVGSPSELGTAVPYDAFADHVFGVVGLNDWSARDIQAWEYVPLGPFLGKSFATSISRWVTPLEALDAAWVDLPGQDPDAAALPRPGRRPGARHRRRGAAQRRGRQPSAVPHDVLVAGPDARPPDRQRRVPAHRRPLRLGHDQRTGARPARLAARARLGRPTGPSSTTATRSCSATPLPAPPAAGSHSARFRESSSPPGSRPSMAPSAGGSG